MVLWFNATVAYSYNYKLSVLINFKCQFNITRNHLTRVSVRNYIRLAVHMSVKDYVDWLLHWEDPPQLWGHHFLGQALARRRVKEALAQVASRRQAAWGMDFHLLLTVEVVTSWLTSCLDFPPKWWELTWTWDLKQTLLSGYFKWR